MRYHCCDFCEFGPGQLALRRFETGGLKEERTNVLKGFL
jgi:hypothetical protein